MTTEETPTTRTPKNRTLPLVLATVALLVIGLVGGYLIGHSRGSSDSAGGPTLGSLEGKASATAHNSSDITFAQMMVPHHTQALAMAKLADTRAGSAGVKKLAASIKAAQQPEIDTMNGWLTSWNAGAGQSSNSMDMNDGHSMNMGDGMMSRSDMTQLATLSGASFDKQFLTMMIGHHNGAITMAQDELKKGKSADALALATSITLTQQAQVTQMRDLLK